MMIDVIEEMMMTDMREEGINHDVSILQKTFVRCLHVLFFTI